MKRRRRRRLSAGWLPRRRSRNRVERARAAAPPSSCGRRPRAAVSSSSAPAPGRLSRSPPPSTARVCRAVGTIAGDDTILVIAGDRPAAPRRSLEAPGEYAGHQTAGHIGYCVLAYSRRPRSSATWPSGAYQADVVTLTMDLGQGRELEAFASLALAAGAASRTSSTSASNLPPTSSGRPEGRTPLYGDCCPMAAALARPLSPRSWWKWRASSSRLSWLMGARWVVAPGPLNLP